MISEAEWEVLRVIWANKEITSSQIIDVLHDKKQWSASTVKTLLRRLEEKNCVRVNKTNRPFYYQARVSEEEMNYQTMIHDLNHLCRTKQGKLLMRLVEDTEMTAEELQQLTQLIATKQKTAPNKVDCQCAYGQCSCTPCCCKKGK